MTAAHNYSKDQLADWVWLRTGKVPKTIRCQALLVVSEFEDGSMAVHRVEDLAGFWPTAS